MRRRRWPSTRRCGRSSRALPWAWAIPASLKRVEGRSWATSHRGPLAIHAARTVDALTSWPDGSPVPAEALAPVRAIVVVVEVVDCVRGRRGAPDPWAEASGWWWLVTNPRRLREPIPWRGQLGLFDVPDRLFK